MFIYRIYSRPVDTGPWYPMLYGQYGSQIMEYTDKKEAEATFDHLVAEEKRARGSKEDHDNDEKCVWVAIPQPPREYKLVRIYADEVKEFK